jgi:hypothetical protein
MVLCEGNFQWGNADFDIYYQDSALYYTQVFKKQNGSPLGDVLQSGLVHDGKIWLVLNNSGKLVAIDPLTFKWMAEIKGLKSPRYILPVRGDTAWVSDIWGNELAIVNLKTNQLLGKIPCKGWTEQMQFVNQQVAVANSTGHVFFFSPVGKKLDSIQVRTGARWIETDKNGKLWVMASDSGKSVLYKINPVSKKTEMQLAFSAGGYGQKLAMNASRDSLYFLNNGLFKMSVEAAVLPVSALFSESKSNYYGLAVDPASGLVYLADAKDYVSKGEVIVLYGSGVVKQRFAAGINPADFLFFK